MNMRRLFMVGAMVLATAGTLVAEESSGKRFAAGPKVWYADNGSKTEPLWGGMASFDVTPRIRVSGMYLQGEYDQEDCDEMNSDSEILAAYHLRYLDLGAGFRYLGFDVDLAEGWRWYTEQELGYDEGAQRNADIYGPMVYAGSSYNFGKSPFGAYGEASWMFKDFGETDDMGFDGQHVNLEGGLTAQWKSLVAAVGYRYKRYADMPPKNVEGDTRKQNVVDGFTASLRVSF